MNVRQIFAVLLLSLCASTSWAVLDTVIGVGGGSFLIGQAGEELQDSIAQAEAAANALLGRADKIAKNRLSQIDEIVQDAIREAVNQSESAVLAVLTDAKAKIDAVRRDTFADVRTVVWELECGAKRALIEDVPTLLGGLGRMLNVNEFVLTPPVYTRKRPSNFLTRRLFDDPYLIKIKAPFDRTFVDVRDLMEEAIADDEVKSDTPAHHIVSTWEYLAAFAAKTSCFFPGGGDVWNEEHVKYLEEARKWRKLVSIRPM